MKIAVLHQSIDYERTDEADTLIQATEIEAHLSKLGHHVKKSGIDTVSELEKILENDCPDIIFNLVESFNKSDKFAYLIPAVLESRKVPFTGNAPLALMLASDKTRVKELLAAYSIPHPAGLEGTSEGKFIVKSVSEHASFGIDQGSVVEGISAAKKLIQEKEHQYGGQWLAEKFIEGREFNLSLLETQEGLLLLPPAEIIFEDFPEGSSHIIDYQAKWDESSHAYHHTPRRFCERTESMERIAEETWLALGLKGYARIDLRIDQQGQLWVIDINPNPCLSSDAGFMASAQQYGLGPQEVIKRILENATHGNIK